LQYDFHDMTTVAAFSFLGEGPHGCPSRVIIQGSADSISWSLITNVEESICGTRHDLPLVSTYRYFRFVFTPLPLPDSVGTENPCGETGQTIYTENSGVIQHTDYGPEEQCIWTIKCRDGETVRLVFSSFDTELSSDYVYVSDMTTLGVLGKLATFSGPINLVSDVESSSSTLRVSFTSDTDGSGAGFEAEYQCIAHGVELLDVTMFMYSGMLNVWHCYLLHH
jgi:hypothetical protein